MPERLLKMILHAFQDARLAHERRTPRIFPFEPDSDLAHSPCLIVDDPIGSNAAEGTDEHQRHFFTADEFQRLHTEIVQVDQSLKLLIFETSAQSGKIVYLEKNAFPLGLFLITEQPDHAPLLDETHLKRRQDTTVIETVFRMAHGDPDGAPRVPVRIGVDDEDADFVPHFQNAVVFQLVDCGADGSGAELECLAQKVLRRQSVSPLHLLIAYVSDKQGFCLFCLSLRHESTSF